MNQIRGSTILFLVLSLLGSNHLNSQEKLEVDGAMTIGNSESITPDPGTIRWTGSDVQGWNGSQWVSLIRRHCL